MAEVKRVNGQPVVDYMARDYDSLLRAMRELIPYKLPEWQDYESEADLGNVLLQLFAHMGDILSYYQDRVANESFLGTAQTRRSIIHHLRLIGYKLATAAPASTNLTLIVPPDKDETITINKGDAFATKSRKDKASVRFEYTREIPLVIDCSALPEARDLATDKEYKLYGSLPDERGWQTSEDPATGEKYKLFEGIPVEEGRLVRAEIVGTSDGTPNKTFSLAHSKLILRSLGQGQMINKDIILISELGSGSAKTIEEWALQESLAFSREGQPDFVIEIDEDDRATIVFGDGAFGAIPDNGAVVKATYRVGGGTQGNVAANTIETIVDAPQLTLLGAKVTNPKAATGGAERESIEHAVSHAPEVFRSLKRAVTADDYKALALDFKGVGKVRAEPAGWNTVKLFVAPQGGGYVSDVLKANLLAYFEDKRPITTTIEIEDVDYVKIYVTAEIGVKGYYDPQEVKKQVQKAGGDLLAFDEVDFGQTIYLSKFYEEIEKIGGVDHVTIREFKSRAEYEDEADSEARGELALGKIKLGANEIPTQPDELNYAGGIRVLLEEDN